ncbi:MAG TPA: PIN domain-containing protein [Chthoniobacteraceae bacterium]|jgi:predicted nucleic acid-binding protein|nr:PIN domain-containing protein [Chthoniobacteraceae bacterium]
MPASLRGTFDTNVVLAAKLSPHATSPTAEILDRWQRRDFTFLYTHDVIAEYAEKLLATGVPAFETAAFLRLLARHGEFIVIAFFHLRHYPADADDIMFLLCALNGRATHLVSYDPHLLTLRPFYDGEVIICAPVEFLADCRKK